MPRKKIGDFRDKRSAKIESSGVGFSELIKKVSDYHFVRMVSKCGLPPREARELCESFRELKS